MCKFIKILCILPSSLEVPRMPTPKIKREFDPVSVVPEQLDRQPSEVPLSSLSFMVVVAAAAGVGVVATVLAV